IKLTVPLSLLLLCTSIPSRLTAQNNQHTVKGLVTNAQNKNALPGVTIRLKGTTTGTNTDANGTYELVVSSLDSDTLQFSSIGFISKVVPLNWSTGLNIQLQPSVVQGKEVVMTALGEEKAAEDVGGAVTSFDSYQMAKLRTAPTSNLTTSLAGRVAGL